MDFDQIILISPHIQPVPQSEIDRLESHFGFAMPLGYKDWMTQLGIGMYCDEFVIYEPKRILKWHEQEAIRRSNRAKYEYPERDHWIYEGSEHILNEAQVEDCIVIGASLGGDQIVIFPPRPDKLYILPRHSNEILEIAADFSDLHRVLFDSPCLQSFIPYHKGRTDLAYYSREYRLDKTTCIEQFKGRWGQNSIVISEDESDKWSWRILFYMPVITGEIHIAQDEGVTRIYTGENVTHTTIGGTGYRYLNVGIGCDVEYVAEVEAFMTELQRQGLVKWTDQEWL